MSALRELRVGAKFVLKAIGNPGMASFQRFSRTVDQAAVSEVETAAGPAVSAACSIQVERIRRANGLIDEAQVLHVEMPAFESLGGLSPEYKVRLEGRWRSLFNVGSEDGTFWQAEVGP